MKPKKSDGHYKKLLCGFYADVSDCITRHCNKFCTEYEDGQCDQCARDDCPIYHLKEKIEDIKKNLTT